CAVFRSFAALTIRGVRSVNASVKSNAMASTLSVGVDTIDAHVKFTRRSPGARRFSPMYIVAHRGAEDLELENSMAAFLAAAPADAVELDVHASLDNQLVVIHDRTAERVAAPDSPHRDAPMASLTVEQIKEITLTNGENVP